MGANGGPLEYNKKNNEISKDEGRGGKRLKKEGIRKDLITTKDEEGKKKKNGESRVRMMIHKESEMNAAERSGNITKAQKVRKPDSTVTRRTAINRKPPMHEKNGTRSRFVQQYTKQRWGKQLRVRVALRGGEVKRPEQTLNRPGLHLTGSRK